MRLLNIHTLEFGEFFESDIPKYYILSHRWGKDELSFKQFKKNPNKDTNGYRKIANACKFAQEWNERIKAEWVVRDVNTPKADWIWIDTCCIDKRSSAELSEAINSMFAWYRKAHLCIVYLSDVSASNWTDSTLDQEFRTSSWFTRGWTLQELLAPIESVFCNVDWQLIGHKCTSGAVVQEHCQREHTALRQHLNEKIAAVTNIDSETVSYFKRFDSVARKMSWVALRKTTRIEDMAYCMLGILDINLPLLYGEGSRAFQRLQEEVLRRSNDQSVFAWQPRSFGSNTAPMLAKSPTKFAGCERVEWVSDSSRKTSFSMTPLGIRADVEIYAIPTGTAQLTYLGRNHFYFVPLNCFAAEEDDAGEIRYYPTYLVLVMRESEEDSHRQWIEGETNPTFVRIPSFIMPKQSQIGELCVGRPIRRQIYIEQPR